MMYLTDSTFVIDFFAGQPTAVTLMPSLLDAGLGSSVVSYMELWEGVAANPDPRRAARQLRLFVAEVRVVPFSQRVARRAALLRVELRQLRRPLEQRALDILIAATALEHDLTLVTSDRDFDDMPELKRLNPRSRA
jgi:predicted nucleic acid-binding protein